MRIFAQYYFEQSQQMMVMGEVLCVTTVAAAGYHQQQLTSFPCVCSEGHRGAKHLYAQAGFRRADQPSSAQGASE